MRRLFIGLLLLCAPLLAQDLNQYAGTWQASFQGKPFVTLNLMSIGGKLTGTVVHDNFNVDSDGNVTGIVPRDAHEKVTLVRQVGDGVDIYTHDDTEPNEAGHYHLELTNADEGQLKLVVIGPTAPKINAWVVKRK